MNIINNNSSQIALQHIDNSLPPDNQSYCSTLALNSNLKANLLIQPSNIQSEKATDSQFCHVNSSLQTSLGSNENKIILNTLASNQLISNNELEDATILLKNSPSLKNRKGFHLKLKKSKIWQYDNLSLQKDGSIQKGNIYKADENFIQKDSSIPKENSYKADKSFNERQFAKTQLDKNTISVYGTDDIYTNFRFKDDKALITRESNSIDKVSLLNSNISSELDVSELKLMGLSKKIDACILNSKKLLSDNKKQSVNKIFSPSADDKSFNVKEFELNTEIKYHSSFVNTINEIENLQKINPMLTKFLEEKKELENKIEYILSKCQKYEPITPLTNGLEFETTSQTNSPITFVSKKKNIPELDSHNHVIINNFISESNQINTNGEADENSKNSTITQVEEQSKEVVEVAMHQQNIPQIKERQFNGINLDETFAIFTKNSDTPMSRRNLEEAFENAAILTDRQNIPDISIDITTTLPTKKLEQEKFYLDKKMFCSVNVDQAISSTDMKVLSDLDLDQKMSCSVKADYQISSTDMKEVIEYQKEAILLGDLDSAEFVPGSVNYLKSHDTQILLSSGGQVPIPIPANNIITQIKKTVVKLGTKKGKSYISNSPVKVKLEKILENSIKIEKELKAGLQKSGLRFNNKAASFIFSSSKNDLNSKSTTQIKNIDLDSKEDGLEISYFKTTTTSIYKKKEILNESMKRIASGINLKGIKNNEYIKIIYEN